MLCKYAKPTAMTQALENLLSMRQGTQEDEDAYNKRLDDAINRCRNVHEEDEKTSFYIDGFLPTNRTVLARLR